MLKLGIGQFEHGVFHLAGLRILEQFLNRADRLPFFIFHDSGQASRPFRLSIHRAGPARRHSVPGG